MKPSVDDQVSVMVTNKGQASAIATLIATRIATQELVKDHNTWKLLQDDVFSLKQFKHVAKFDQPNIQCQVKDDLSKITLTYDFYRSDTDEARKFREQTSEHEKKIGVHYKNFKSVQKHARSIAKRASVWVK